jgi:hypothetical protein
MALAKPGPIAPPVCLPPPTRASLPLTLVLDLDETLVCCEALAVRCFDIYQVHCSLEPIADADFSFPLKLNDAEVMVCSPFRVVLFLGFFLTMCLFVAVCSQASVPGGILERGQSAVRSLCVYCQCKSLRQPCASHHRSDRSLD